MTGIILYFHDDIRARVVSDLVRRHQQRDGAAAVTITVISAADAAVQMVMQDRDARIIITDSEDITGKGVIYAGGADVRLGGILDGLGMAMRQMAQDSRGFIAIGEYELDLRESELRGGKAVIRLTEKESLILDVLASFEGREVDREYLLAKIWGYGANIETHTLETHIYRLRQKIEDDPAQPRILLTVENGYRLGAV